MVVCYSPVYRSLVCPVPTAPEHLDWPACVSPRSCVCCFGEMSRVTSGVLLACYSPSSRSPVSPVATARIHTLMTDTFDACSCMPVPVSQCHFGFTTSHVGPGSLSYGCKRHYHIREPKGANGPGPGKVAPVEIPWVRPQSDMMCYMLDRRGLGSGS